MTPALINAEFRMYFIIGTFVNAALYVFTEGSSGQNLGGNVMFSLAPQSKLVESIQMRGTIMIREPRLSIMIINHCTALSLRFLELC